MTRVDLAGLDDAALSELILARFPGRWSPGVLRQVVALAAGSPYAALELARETVARGGRDGMAVHLPSTLSGSLRSRLDRLGPRTLAVVQAAALAGAPTRGLLRAVAGRPVGEQVDEALEAGVLEAAPPDPVLRFSHPLLRETAEGMLSGPARRRLHRVIGAALDDPDEAAWHLARGADEPDEALAERVEQAAQDASCTRRAPPALRRWPEWRPSSPRIRTARTRGGAALSGWSSLKRPGEYEQVRRLGEKWALDVPVVAARAAHRRARGCGDRRRTACRLLAEAFEDLAGRDPARAARVGTQYARHVGVCWGGWMKHAPALRRPSRRHARPVTRSSCGERWPRTGSSRRWRAKPMPATGCARRCGCPGSPTRHIPYEAPETFLAMWYLWRGELDPARDLLNAVIDRR